MVIDEFPLDDDIIHLNHAAVAPWPRCSARAVQAFAEENASRGSQCYDRWLQRETECRRRLATLINAESPDEIALLKSTSEGLSIIAAGLAWDHGDNVVIPAGEFPSNRYPWQALERRGVDTRQVAILDAENPEQALVDAMDERTRLLSVSAVQFAGGFRLDLEKLGAACRSRSVLFCIDAIQALGALDFDARRCHADFVVADGHKWLLSAEGLALFYCPRRNLDRLALQQFGWHMAKDPFNHDKSEWEPLETAQRFECGSPNMLGVTALHASLGLLLETGMQTVERRVLDNTRYCVAALDRAGGIDVLSSRDPLRQSGIVLFRKHGVDQQRLYTHLQNRGVLCALRAGGIRFAAHYYTPKEKIDNAIQLVKEYI